MIELRFFAAARAAVGASAAEAMPGPLLSALSAFTSPVIGRCSFLVNGIATTDLSIVLVDGDRVDVMPPFAGG
jgi:molybdopterin converting factor small subunit